MIACEKIRVVFWVNYRGKANKALYHTEEKKYLKTYSGFSFRSTIIQECLNSEN